MLAQTEVERVKFVVRSYLRTRLYKVRNSRRAFVRTRKPTYRYRSKSMRDSS